MPAYRRFKRKEGVYKWRFQGGIKGQKYCSPAVYNTKKDAELAETLHVEKLKVGSEKDRLSYMKACRLRALEARKSSSDPMWHYKESERMLGILESNLGDIPVQDITRPMLREVIDEFALDLSKRGKSLLKANAMIRIFKAFFNWMIDEMDIDMKNPMKKYKLFPTNKKMKYIPTDSEVNRVARKLNYHQTKLFKFVEETGCRINEAINLKAEDINGEYITLYTTKAKNADRTPRTVPMPDCMKSWKTIPEEGRVFDMWTTWPHFLKEHAKTWNWHNLRHRRASLWMNNGMPIFEIMYRLGHSNLKTTQNYLQLLGFSPVRQPERQPDDKQGS